MVLPTYNEAENVKQIVVRALAALPPGSHVLVVDDDSPDGTGRLAEDLASREPSVEVLHRSKREGLGHAYLHGFAYALERGAEVVCQMDADFSHDPATLPDLIAALSSADVVLGSRYVPGGKVEDWGLARRLLSRGGSLYARVILQLPLRDLTSGFKAYRRQALGPLLAADVEAAGYVFQVETTYRAWRAGRRIVEIPITFRDRAAGTSKMTLAIAAEAAWRVPLMRWRLREARRRR